MLCKLYKIIPESYIFIYLGAIPDSVQGPLLVMLWKPYMVARIKPRFACARWYLTCFLIFNNLLAWIPYTSWAPEHHWIWYIPKGPQHLSSITFLGSWSRILVGGVVFWVPRGDPQKGQRQMFSFPRPELGTITQRTIPKIDPKVPLADKPLST